MSELLTYFQERQQAMTDLLTTLVNYETPSHDKNAVDRLGGFFEGYFKSRGASSVTRHKRESVGDILLAKWNENALARPITIMGHMDTVWAIGTLAERPIRIDDEGRFYGPGAVDMKAGLVAALSAIQGLMERREMPQRPIWFLATSDEEIGSKHSSELIQDVARQSDLVLVLEPGTKEGAIKTARKGVATFRVSIEGRASHAGNAPEEGINAIIEMAQQALRLNQLNDLKNGTSVSVTMANAGTAGNVIPAQASLFIDTRTVTQQAMNDVKNAILGIQPFVPGAKVLAENLHTRYPMEYNEQMHKTFTRCQEIAKHYNLTVRGEHVGGGSDGNITASIGVPTLDGLGPYGDGLHAVHEHVILRTIPQRTALVAAILKDW